MPRLRPKSFSAQLMLGSVIVQVLCLILFIWYTVVTQRREGEERARARIVRQLDRLSAACSTDFEQNDAQSLQGDLELSRIAPTIEIARVTDLQGQTLAVTKNASGRELDPAETSVLSDPTRQQVFKTKNGQLEAVTPIVVKGRPVALLWLEPSMLGSTTTTMIVVQIAMTYGGFALLANLFPIFIIVRTMTKPLNTLRAASNRVISDPNQNAGFPLPVTTENEAGDLTISVNAMVHELEERRRTLAETVALLDSMLRNAPIGFAFFDRELRYVRVNEFLADLHGLPIEDHLGRKPIDVYPSSVGEPKVQCLERVFKTGQAVRDVELSGEMPLAPGVERTWMMHFYPVRTTQDVINWVGVIVVEITDRLKSEEALRKSEKLAATGRLAASIAHEINNPLEAVTNILYLLETDQSLHEGASQLVATGQAELARVSEITQQTLRFHRQSSAAASVNISDLLESLLRLYQSRIRSLSISVSTKFDVDAIVHGFGGELRQVFANLVGNAIDAMPRGGFLRLSARRGHGLDLGGVLRGGVRVFVTDSGIGMTEETRRRVFDAFFTTKEATGTGLGLWVSDGIIRKHHGTMQVRSRCGDTSGTSFMIFIPSENTVRDLESSPAS